MDKMFRPFIKPPYGNLFKLSRLQVSYYGCQSNLTMTAYCAKFFMNFHMPEQPYAWEILCHTQSSSMHPQLQLQCHILYGFAFSALSEKFFPLQIWLYLWIWPHSTRPCRYIGPPSRLDQCGISSKCFWGCSCSVIATHLVSIYYIWSGNTGSVLAACHLPFGQHDLSI